MLCARILTPLYQGRLPTYHHPDSPRQLAPSVAPRPQSQHVYADVALRNRLLEIERSLTHLVWDFVDDHWGGSELLIRRDARITRHYLELRLQSVGFRISTV